MSPPGTDQGVSSTQIKIAVFVLQVVGPAGNSIASIPSPSEQEEDFSQVMDTVNASGGIACRKLVPQFFTINPVDQTSLQQTCLNVQQAAPFAVFDPGAYALNPATADCYPQNAIPYMYNSSPPAKQQARDYPYLFSTSSVAEVLYRNTVFALNQHGFFSAASGFKKLGIIYRDCEPEYLGEEQGWLNQIGLSSSQVVTYDLGCSSSIYAPPSSVEQAVLTFQQDGVTNVTEINEFTDFNNFTSFAGRQSFKPKYGIPNDQVLATSTGSPHADYNNLDGAIAISSDREGENTTPGYVPSSGTARCNAIMIAHGRPPIYQQEDGFGGVACSLVWMLQAALSHAPAVKRSALAIGLQAARSVDFSFAFGPNDYSGNHVTTGGQYWRAVQFFNSCGCWHVTDPTFNASFP